VKIISKLLKALSAVRGARSLRRMVRRLAGILLGERNAINLYGEDDTAKQFEAQAKRIGATVVACDFESGHDPLLEWVVYPLADSKNEKGNGQQNEVALRNGLRLNRNGSNEASSTSDSESVPPVIYLKPGERITHVMVKSSNKD
jgi:hypothetical protein